MGKTSRTSIDTIVPGDLRRTRDGDVMIVVACVLRDYEPRVDRAGPVRFIDEEPDQACWFYLSQEKINWARNIDWFQDA